MHDVGGGRQPNPLPDLPERDPAAMFCAAVLLRLDELEKRIGNRVLYRGASAVVRAKDRIGVVGPNGAGKTTLLRALIGDEPNDAGTIHSMRGIRIGMLRQEIDPRATHSIRQEVRSAFAELDALEAELRALESEMEMLGARGDSPSETSSRRYDEASARFAQGGGFEIDARIAEMLAGLGFEDDTMDRPLSSFSGGWLMRVELAKLLLLQPEVLLLDEPTNHLDLPSIQFFEATLERIPGAVLLVSHDRTFLGRHTNRIIELDGRGGFALYEGGYASYLDQRAQRREELLARSANQDRKIAETERFIERFRAKASKARQAQSRIKALAKIERIETQPDGRRGMRLRIPEPRRSGECVLSLKAICKSYGEDILYSGIDLSLSRGEKIALVGPNGAGKSTLLRIAAGALDFDAGERILGPHVEFAFFAQHQLEALEPTASVLEELARHAHIDEVPRLRAHLGAFLFSGDDVEKKIAILSGGEKARVALAKLLLRPANFLILDEPTNHLDIEACEVLEEALRAYSGTLLFVSHDRAFINALATRVVEVEHGRLENHLGNYDDYLDRKLRHAQKTDTLTAHTRPDPEANSSPSTSNLDSDSAPITHKEARLRQRERHKARTKATRRIERIESEITQLEAQRAALNERLGEPSAYLDAERSRTLQLEQATLSSRVDALYQDWEELSESCAALDDV